jgi:NifU-like protein
VTSFYPKAINRYFASPQNTGIIDNASASGTDASFVCGCFVRISLQIEAGEKKIEEVKFQTNGCGYMVAAADVLAGEIRGRELTELQGSENIDLKTSVESTLGKFLEHRGHCLETCISALHAAFADYRNRLIEEFRGEKALICTCFGISEESVERCIAENAPETAAEVADLCKAGSGCGSCRMLIQEMIDTQALTNR